MSEKLPAKQKPMASITKWASADGEFRRQVSSFRNFIAKNSVFEPQSDRYALYISLACPWAHRTLIMLKLKGLESIIQVSTVHWEMKELGWRFGTDDDEFPGVTVDKVNNFKYIRELYFKADPQYNARFTVPFIWDKEKETIVNNESSEILRMLSTCFNDFIKDKDQRELNLYPTELQADIDSINEWVYDSINNGVYKSGFATSQKAYDENVVKLFEGLNRMEKHLSRSDGPYVLGKTLTEADVRLFTTIIRFDCTYVQHFKCDLGTIRHNYPHLNRWMRSLYFTNDAFRTSTDFDHVRFHYTRSHPQINPTGITPRGPQPRIEPFDPSEWNKKLPVGYVETKL